MSDDDYDWLTDTGYDVGGENWTPPSPLFGCACQDATFVDTVCRGCREAMGQVIVSDGGGYRRTRRRLGYDARPSRHENQRRYVMSIELARRQHGNDIPF